MPTSSGGTFSATDGIVIGSSANFTFFYRLLVSRARKQKHVIVANVTSVHANLNNGKEINQL